MRGANSLPILALTGPTAVGKTELALALADRLGVALISMDSAMIYRGMDIGTAKPEPVVLERYPHALIDIRSPSETYSVAEFVEDADTAVRKILYTGRVPLLVGGSMLYLKGFREGIAPMPSADPMVRARLADEARRLGTEALHARLAAIDPQAAALMHPNNFTRIQRALEVHALTGRTISSHWGAARGVEERLGARLIEFAVEPASRGELHEQIARRLEHMLAAGFVEEVAGLKDKVRLHRELPSMRAVGYRQVWDFLDGLVTEAEMRENALAATRQLAKRQLTWIRSWPEVRRLSGGNLEALMELISTGSGLNP